MLRVCWPSLYNMCVYMPGETKIRCPNLVKDYTCHHTPIPCPPLGPAHWVGTKGWTLWARPKGPGGPKGPGPLRRAYWTGPKAQGPLGRAWPGPTAGRHGPTPYGRHPRLSEPSGPMRPRAYSIRTTSEALSRAPRARPKGPRRLETPPRAVRPWPSKDAQ